MKSDEFITTWKMVEPLYDQICGYPGAMAEDLKGSGDLEGAISNMVQNGLIRWDSLDLTYVLTEKGMDMGKKNIRSLPDQNTTFNVRKVYIAKDPGIVTFEQQQPELTAEFRRIQEEQYKTFCQKMISYGLYNISVGTNLETEKEKLLSLTGIWFRMNDKIQRLKQLLILKEENHLDNEPVEDAWKDISVYSIISQIVNNDKWINKK